MIEIILQNIQSIRQAKYEFPLAGFVKITGGNSNGKSILVKTLNAITSLEIMDEKVRRSLINDNAIEGAVIITARGKALAIKLHEERNKCFVSLTREDGEKIVRTFRDGGIDKLLWEFGFRVYDRNQICLQIYETFGLMPFVNTSPTVNGEIIEAVTEDQLAKEFLTAFKEHTYKKAKDTIKSFETAKASWENVLRNIVHYDYAAYESLASRMDEIYNVLCKLNIVQLEELTLPPNINFINLEPFTLDKLVLPPDIEFIDFEAPALSELKFIEVMPHIRMLDNISTSIIELTDALNGVCPTCGKPLYEDLCQS